jgi:hypothetical protein
VVEIVALQDDVGRAVGRLEHDGRRAVVRRKGPPRRLKHFVLDLGRDNDLTTFFGRVAGGQADDVGGVEVGRVEDGAHFVAGGLWVGVGGHRPPLICFPGHAKAARVGGSRGAGTKKSALSHRLKADDVEPVLGERARLVKALHPRLARDHDALGLQAVNAVLLEAFHGL